MRISIALCTRNRSRQLRATLEQMTRLAIPPNTDWELIVVNNGSEDATDAVIRRTAGRLPIQHLTEPRPGLSHARNRAVQAATGQYIVWTDDDVAVPSGWLAAYREAFARWPEAAIFGGPIRPVFLGQPPRWLERVKHRVGAAYAARLVAHPPAPIVPFQALPFGANMAIRTAEQRSCRYDPRLGVQPNCQLLGEETTCLRTLFARGAVGWWVPSAVVHHLIPSDRQTLTYLWRYFRAQGELDARTQRDPYAPTVLGRPAWMWRQFAEAAGRYLVGRAWSVPERWIEDLIQAGYAWGMLRGSVHSTLDLTHTPGM